MLKIPWAVCTVNISMLPLAHICLEASQIEKQAGCTVVQGQELRHSLQEEKQVAAKEVSQQPQPSQPPEQPPQQSESDAAAPPQRPLRRGQGESYTDIPNSQVLVPEVVPQSPSGRSLNSSSNSTRAIKVLLLSQTRLPQSTDMADMQIRKIIAKRLLESKLEVPHYYLRGHADLKTVNSLRQLLKEQGSKVRTTQLSMLSASASMCGAPHGMHARNL